MRLKVLRGSLLFDSILIAILLGLMYVFLQRHNRFRSSSSTTVPRSPLSLNLDVLDSSGNKQHAAPDTSVLIDTRIKMIQDLRPKQCKRMIYNLDEKATLVIDFNDYQFYDLKNTVQSILNQNYDQLLEEIIVIDDGSTLEYIRQDVVNYLKQVPKARLVQYTTQQGTLKARIAVMREVKTDIVVFLEANVICSRGWLEPLIDILMKDHQLIAVPHYDRIHSPVTLEYQQTSDDFMAVPSWNFAIKMQQIKNLSEDTKTLKFFYFSPAFRGNAFAIRKSFLDSIGSFDSNFEEGGGDILELSLRTWMCGGMVEMMTCSRVGILNLDESVKPYSQKNCQRIAGLWFGNMKATALRLAGIPTTIPESEEAQIAVRSRYISSLRQCKDIQWYMRDVIKDAIMPSEDAVKFGTISVMSGRCGRLTEDGKIELIDCSETAANRSPNVMFELTTSGHLKIDGKCLTTENTAYIRLRDCRADDKQQLWIYKAMELVNVWSNFCATHVTDPDTSKHLRQIMMAQSCDVPSDHAAFKQWQFQMD